MKKIPQKNFQHSSSINTLMAFFFLYASTVLSKWEKIIKNFDEFFKKNPYKTQLITISFL